MWLKLLNRSWFPGLNVSHCKLPEEKCGGLKPRSRGLGWIKITQQYISHWTLSRLFSTNWLWFKRMDRPFEFLVRLQFKGKSGKMGSSFSGFFFCGTVPVLDMLKLSATYAYCTHSCCGRTRHKKDFSLPSNKYNSVCKTVDTSCQLIKTS